MQILEKHLQRLLKQKYLFIYSSKFKQIGGQGSRFIRNFIRQCKVNSIDSKAKLTFFIQKPSSNS